MVQASRVKNTLAIALVTLSSLALTLMMLYQERPLAPKWKEILPDVPKPRSSRQQQHEEVPLHHIVEENIWGVSEASFLKTPFYDGGQNRGHCNARSTYKFKAETSPWKMSLETIKIGSIPNLNIEDFYLNINGSICLKISTDEEASKRENRCVCKPLDLERIFTGETGYNGSHCSLPGSVWRVQGRIVEGLDRFKLRPARRAIMGLVVDHELEMTEIRLRQLNHVVDVFVILESRVTAGGDFKPLYFYDAFRKGFLCEFQHKILYVYMDKFPDGYIEDGWLADNHLRDVMSQSALSRIQGLKNDDLFFSFDADEIPKPEIVLFLRFHSGYTNPILFNLRWTIYKFYWQQNEKLTKIVAACTIDFLKEVCDGNAISMRKKYFVADMKNFEAYKGPKSVYPFEIGIQGDYSGHHCSWCTTPEGISIKLRSAIHQDFPRWGDYPEKLKVDYLEKLINTGSWFDGSNPTSFVPQSSDPDFAPIFVMTHRQIFHDMLSPPTTTTTTTTTMTSLEVALKIEAEEQAPKNITVQEMAPR